MDLEKIQSAKNNARLLFDKAAVEGAIEQLAVQLNRDYQTLNPVLLVVMNGGLLLAGKLMSQLEFPAQLDYCHATRYRGETSGAEIVWKVEPQLSLTDRHVVIIDDILDEGYTLQAITDKVKLARAASVKSLVLVEKLHQRKSTPGLKPDYCQLQCPDEYIFGCGMDYQHYWRNTDAIYSLGDE